MSDFGHEPPMDHYMACESGNSNVRPKSPPPARLRRRRRSLTRALYTGKGGMNPPVAQSQMATNIGLIPFTSALINGRGQYKNRAGGYSTVNVTQGNATRLRIINTGENFALRVSIDSHTLTIIGASEQSSA